MLQQAAGKERVGAFNHAPPPFFSPKPPVVPKCGNDLTTLSGEVVPCSEIMSTSVNKTWPAFGSGRAINGG